MHLAQCAKLKNRICTPVLSSKLLGIIEKLFGHSKQLGILE